MDKALLIGSLVAGLSFSIPAYAQTADDLPVRPPATSIAMDKSLGHWGAIAAGAVIGAVLADVILPTAAAYIIGGFAGADIGNALYPSSTTGNGRT